MPHSSRDYLLALRSSTSLRSWLLPALNIVESRFRIHGTIPTARGKIPVLTSGNDRRFQFPNPWSVANDA